MATPGVALQDLQERYQLSKALLDAEVSEDNLEEASRIIGDHEILGTALRLTSWELSHGKRPEILRLEMLRKWKQKLAWKATYRRLIESLLKWDRADYARDIAVLLNQSTSTEQPSIRTGHSAALPTSPTSQCGATSPDGTQNALEEVLEYGQNVEGRAGERDREIQEKEELIQQLIRENQKWKREVKEREGDIEHFQHQVKQKDGELREREREVREREENIQCLRSQLQQKEGEVRKRERDVTEVGGEKRSLQDEVLELKRAVTLKVEEIQQLQGIIQEKDMAIHQLQQTQQSAPSYTCPVSGTGVHSTANHQTHVIVEVSDSSGRPCSLQSTSQATPTSDGWSNKSRSNQPPAIDGSVVMVSPCRYEMSYTAVQRSQYKLHIQVNGSEINGSPFTMTMYPDPTQLGSPVRVVTGLNRPYGIAINGRGEMVVAESDGHQVSVFDVRGQRVRQFGSRGIRPEQINAPAGVAVDDMDNIYLSSEHKLQKFTSSGELIKCIRQRGSKEGEFNDPRGVTIHNNQVYVCDFNNDRIQVFDLDLNFIQSIGSQGKGRGEFHQPLDIAFDTAGNMYVAEYGSARVQVLDCSGQFIRMFCQEGKGKLSGPTAIHVADKYVYISDYVQHRIVVYQTLGHFVTSFGKYGRGEGEFFRPYCITSCANGFIHVCDYDNKRVQIF